MFPTPTPLVQICSVQGGGTMDSFTPWAICIGVFMIYPAIAFVIGFYVGRRGLPFDIQVSRKPGWGKSMTDDDYGIASETS